MFGVKQVILDSYNVDKCKANRRQRLQWSRGSALPVSSQFRGFKPGRSRQDFQGRKILSAPSFEGEGKPSVPCRRCTACKRFLDVALKSKFWQNYWLIFSSKSSTFRCLDLSRRVGRGDIWWRKWERLKHKGG